MKKTTIKSSSVLGLALGAIFLACPLSASAYVFAENLAYGARGNEVTRLQEFLKSDPSIYPEGVVSGWFGPLTRKAVIRFQEKRGIKPAAGYFGPLTRAEVGRMAAPTASLSPKALKPSVKIKDAEAKHSCAIEPFSQTIGRGESAEYQVTLKPWMRENRIKLLTGSLPVGITAAFTSPAAATDESTLSLTVSDSAEKGSFNVVVIYEEIGPDDVAMRSFCQMNLAVE